MAQAQQAWQQHSNWQGVGHDVDLLEKNDRIGGLLRYGIPDFKMEKTHIDRRMDQMQAEGVNFKTNQNVGVDINPMI